MGLFRSNSWGLALIFCTHDKKKSNLQPVKIWRPDSTYFIFYDFRMPLNREHRKKIQKCLERRTACWNPPLKSWNEFRDTKMEKGTSQFC